MDKAGLLAFIRMHRHATQSTVSPSGAPQAAVVGFAVTDELEIIFDTLVSTRKVVNLRLNPRIAFVIGGFTPGDERTLQYEGIADQPSGAELDRLTRAYYAAHPDGPSRLNWPGLTYVRVRPSWIRYSDFNKNPPEILELRETELQGWCSNPTDGA